jgi:O-antigen ligase
MSLISINLYKNDQIVCKFVKLSAFILGSYLSLVSGSRTGWAAIPLVLLLWIYIKLSGKHLLIALILVLVFIKALFFIPIVQQRIDIAISEILSYQWQNLNPDTSVGMRISFIRIGLFLFSQNLFSGWGDLGFKEMLKYPELFQFASVYAKETLSIAGFHNEIIANMVRSGIWGFISSTSIFLVPALFFIKGLYSTSIMIRHCALIAMSYLICVFITSITTEVFSSKLTVSFYAIIMVNLIGSLFVMMSSDQQLKKI